MKKQKKTGKSKVQEMALLQLMTIVILVAALILLGVTFLRPAAITNPYNYFLKNAVETNNTIEFDLGTDYHTWYIAVTNTTGVTVDSKSGSGAGHIIFVKPIEPGEYTITWYCTDGISCRNDYLKFTIAQTPTPTPVSTTTPVPTPTSTPVMTPTPTSTQAATPVPTSTYIPATTPVVPTGTAQPAPAETTFPQTTTDKAKPAPVAKTTQAAGIAVTIFLILVAYYLIKRNQRLK